MMKTLLSELLLLESASPSPSNVDGKFTVGEVTFDNDDGLGATPSNRNVMYAGAVAWIKPSTFRKLAVEADRSDTAKEMESLIKSGKSIAVPFLIIDIIEEPENPKSVKVKGHEGRARSDAFKSINGDIYMPVQLHPIGIRARHLSEEFFKWIEENGLIAEKSSNTVKLNAKEYFWNGSIIKP